MVRRLVSIDTADNQLPDTVREQAAANFANADTVEGGTLFNRFARRTVELNFDYSAAADGALPDPDSGQTWTLYSNGSGAALQIIDGRMSNATTDAGARAGYAQVTLDGNVTHMRSEFDFGPYTTTNGAMTLAVWKEDGSNLVAEGVPDSPCHLVVTPTAWAYGVFNGEVLTNIATGTFATPLATDGTVHEAAVAMVGDTAYVTLPDGGTRVVTDSRIETNAGRYAVFEVYAQDASTDSKVGFIRGYADSATSGPLSANSGPAQATLVRREVVDEIIGFTTRKVYAPATLDTIAVPSATADVKTGETELTVRVPPSGSVEVVLTAWLSVQASSRVLWSLQQNSTTLSTLSVVTGAYTGNASARFVLNSLTPGGVITVKWRHFYAGGTGANLLAHLGGGYPATMIARPL